MLRNPLYLVLIRHKTVIHPGEHTAIIDLVTWDKAQSLLEQNIRGQRRKECLTEPSLFTGTIFDASDNRYSPTHSNKNGCRYRYYTSRAAIHKTKHLNSPIRIPSPGS